MASVEVPLMLGDIRITARKPRIFDIKGVVSAPLPQAFEDWPNHAKDVVYQAMERILQQTGCKELEIIGTGCWPDKGLWQMRVVLAEKLGLDDMTVETLQ